MTRHRAFGPCVTWKCPNFTGYDETGYRHGSRGMCWRCLNRAKREEELVPISNHPEKDTKIKCAVCAAPYDLYRHGVKPMCRNCYDNDWYKNNPNREAVLAANRIRSVEKNILKRKGMFDLAIAVIGSGDTTYNNAADLLNDYLPDNHLVMVPNYITTEGLRTVVKFLTESDVNFKRVRRSKIIEILEEVKTKSAQLVILNSDGLENEISHCLNHGIPVLDLTKGLYQLRLVRDLPPDGSVSHAETVLDDSPPWDTNENDLAVEKLTARIDQLEKEVKELRAHVGVSESNWEPNVARNLPVSEPENVTTGSEDTARQTVTYYKSKKGKFRKAGRSKARPGEEAVELTEEEIASLPDS